MKISDIYRHRTEFPYDANQYEKFPEVIRFDYDIAMEKRLKAELPDREIRFEYFDYIEERENEKDIALCT